MRFDSGFWSNAAVATLERLEDVGYHHGRGDDQVQYSSTTVRAIDESAWTPIEYTQDGEAEVAECEYKGRRLIVRRTRLIGRQGTLWPQWRHFAFVTDLQGHPVDVDAFHRDHANVDWPSGISKRERDSSTFPRAILRQCRLAGVCSPGPRPHPLDRHARRDHPSGPTNRGTDRAHSLLLTSRPPRQPLGSADIAYSSSMALGHDLLARSHPLQPRYPRSPCRKGPPRPAHRRRPQQALTSDDPPLQGFTQHAPIARDLLHDTH